MGSLGDGESGDGEFRKWGVQEMGSLGDGEFRS